MSIGIQMYCSDISLGCCNVCTAGSMLKVSIRREGGREGGGRFNVWRCVGGEEEEEEGGWRGEH